MNWYLVHNKNYPKVKEAAASTSLERAGANFYQLFSEPQVDREVNCVVKFFLRNCDVFLSLNNGGFAQTYYLAKL